MRAPRLTLRLVVLALTSFAFAGPADAATPRVHALVGARIVTAPGAVIPHGTIVIRDGLIAAVGASVPVPADARVWNGDSLTVYAGLLDAYVTKSDGGAAGVIAGAQLRSGISPQTRMADSLPLGKDQREALRAAGFTAVQLVPATGIFRGQSAVAELGDGAARAVVLRPDAALAVALEIQRSGYPGSLMGAVAVVRQGFSDGRWYRDAQAAYARAPRASRRPDTDPALEALAPALAGKQPVQFATNDMLELLRCAALAREAQVSARALASGDEYKRIHEVAATALELIVPVDFPEAPEVANDALSLDVPITRLRSWNEAPGNPAALARAGVSFSLTSFRLKDPKRFRAQVAKAIERGLPADAALAAVTTRPAALLGLGDRLGRIAPGMIANLTVTRGDLFAEGSEVREVWVDGDRYETTKDEALEGRWNVSWGHGHATLVVALKPDTTIKLVVGPDTLRAREVELETRRMHFVVQRGQEHPEIFDLRLDDGRLFGTLAVTGVGSHDVIGVRAREDKKKDAKKDEPVVTPAIAGDPEPWRTTKPAQPGVVLVRNATVWTAGPQGILRGADLLVRAGKIAGVGVGLKAPAGALVIDGTGKHVVPGIIDEHSHSAILGSVNECTNSVTAEVRIQDVVNSESINIYRQLAGGTTAMHLLHGSCNAIGGQCAVIKNRWGEPPDGLLMANVPPTIKFALGENPKQANWGAEATGRYPQTRAGVEQVIRDVFVRARDYRARQAEYRAHHRGLPPRRDLQLEAVAEVIEGKRIVHCHSYRQDEILMLMHVAEDFGFRIGTFTHVLEGYKIADEMAAHGAVGSTFSDWWAYKFEVIDAIPYNGYLMWDRGVVVCYNSDSDNLARRLNTEAAKAVKYGGVPEAEAIKFVTLNPAISLGIQDRVGSLEVGKDADFSIWDGSPLSYMSHCEQTWVDGRKYFDLASDRAALEADRASLIARAKKAKTGEGSSGAGDAKPTPRYLLESDRSGNTCGAGDDEGPAPEALRREQELAP